MPKKITFVIVLIVVLGAILTIFWYEQYQYYRSVGIPVGASEVNLLDTIYFRNEFIANSNKDMFIHFFDVACKFSKINIEHIRLFTAKYENEFDFFVVIMGDHNQTYIDKFKGEFEVPDFVVLISDKECRIAKKSGVFSTPQAIIVNVDKTLYFRGNYNSETGLCTPANIGSSSPAVAIRYKINNAPAPKFPPYMILPWGCELSINH